MLCSSDGLNIFPSLCIQNGFDVFSFFTNALGALFLLCNKLLSPLYFDLNVKGFEMCLLSRVRSSSGSIFTNALQLAEGPFFNYVSTLGYLAGKEI